MPIYQKSTKELFEEFVQSFVPPPRKGFGLIERKPLSEGGRFTRKEILTWFQDNYSKIKQATVNAHLTIMSINAPSRIHHNLRQNGADDLLFQIDRSTFRLKMGSNGVKSTVDPCRKKCYILKHVTST